jgi:D-glycero-D-manno-heptose 1,7-bisphosphate phosphatase
MLAARGATVEFTLCCGYDHKSPRRKPSGGMLREALARYGAAPAETPFIGDRLTTSRRLSTPGAGVCSSAQALAARRGDGLPQCSPVAVHDDLAAVVDAQLAGKL